MNPSNFTGDKFRNKAEGFESPTQLPASEEVDRRFFDSSRPYMPCQELPFEEEIPYLELPNLDVLEIGVGSGSHAGLIAPRARSFTGIDLTEPGVESTRKRMELLGVKTERVMQMDAEEMTFRVASFDYIWTWGVIHHSANTRTEF